MAMTGKEVRFTFGPRCNSTVLDNIEAAAKLAHDAAILLINQDDPSGQVRAMTAPDISLALVKVGWVIWGRLVSSSFSCLGSSSIGGSALLWRRSWSRCSLEEGGTLCENRFKGIDVLLDVGSAADDGELEASECAVAGAEIPSRNQVAAGGLVVDLSRRRHGKIELRRQMQVEVEVLLSVSIPTSSACRVCEARRRRHHQQRQGLRP
jgi:hypothetical protein